MSHRRAGINVPLFSLRSSTGWGIGELTDIVPFSAWLATAGVQRLMLLPLGTMQPGETSPYAAASTMAIDPIYVAVGDLVDFQQAGGVDALTPAARAALDLAQRSHVVAHEAVRRAKDDALGLAFTSFLTEEWAQLTTRASQFAAYVARERWWLEDYALFEALSRARPSTSWREWPAPLRDRDPHALDDVRRQLSREVLQQQYWQWIAELQWQSARVEAAALGVAVVGDLPFVAGMQSAEVWARAEEFRLDVSVGVPPDPFSPTGQDWGLPAYDWNAIAASGYAWIRQRARRMAALYHGIRVDHTVGLYRTFGRPPHGEPSFMPPEEAAQWAQGEAVLGILRDSGLELIAEDLGSVPDFVRVSLATLGIPGCKVMRWERQWAIEGQPFEEPSRYPPCSATMTGTHDTEPLALWWAVAAPDERAALLALPSVRARGFTPEHQTWTEALRDTLIALAYHAGSLDAYLPIQDVFGWADRINVPGTVGPHNWTWSLPWPVDRLAERPEARERAGFLQALGTATRRVHYTSDLSDGPEGQLPAPSIA